MTRGQLGKGMFGVLSVRTASLVKVVPARTWLKQKTMRILQQDETWRTMDEQIRWCSEVLIDGAVVTKK